MLLLLEEDVIINTTQIVSITKSNMTKMPSVLRMTNNDTHFHKLKPKELADKIERVVAKADTYIFTTF